MLWRVCFGCLCVVKFYFCDRASVTMTDLPEVMPFLQKNIDINRTVWNSFGGKVCTEVLQWGSDLQDWKTTDLLLLADCVYYMEVTIGTIKTEEAKKIHSKIYRALSMLSLGSKFVPCLDDMARVVFVSS